MEDTSHADRERMIREQIVGRGLTNSSVLPALQSVPRHLFVPATVRADAYEDRPLPIGWDQTISQPYIVAYMTEALEAGPTDTVLEIGTGSGYQTAILAAIAREVLTIEVVPELAERARETLAATGVHNVQVLTGSGWRGWPERAPFPRIIVTAAPPHLPDALVDQLAVGGRMVVPIGTGLQEMMIVTKTETGIAGRRTIPVRFVPMIDPGKE